MGRLKLTSFTTMAGKNSAYMNDANQLMSKLAITRHRAPTSLSFYGRLPIWIRLKSMSSSSDFLTMMVEGDSVSALNTWNTRRPRLSFRTLDTRQIDLPVPDGPRT